ncbi:MAG: acyl carrier protein [Frankia sp.]
MTEFTRVDLARTMRMAAGEDESVDLDGDILDLSFEDLGYDSLAVMETASAVEREFALTLPEEDMSTIETPREFLALVNDRLKASA